MPINDARSQSFRPGPQSGGAHSHVSSPLRLARSVRISRTTRSCTLLAKAYGTYQAGAAFVEWMYETRYSLKSPSSAASVPVMNSPEGKA